MDGIEKQNDTRTPYTIHIRPARPKRARQEDSAYWRPKTCGMLTTKDHSFLNFLVRSCLQSQYYSDITVGIMSNQ